MNEMIEFCTAILNAICDFLMEPPIFYLFSLICFAVIVGIVRSLGQFTRNYTQTTKWGLLTTNKG